jgi:hypothetical protein
MVAVSSDVRAAANEAYRALCRLEDVLDVRQSQPLSESGRAELHLLRRRWEHNTAPRISRAEAR